MAIGMGDQIGHITGLPEGVASIVLLAHGDEPGQVLAALTSMEDAVPLERRDMAVALALLARAMMEDTKAIDREAEGLTD